MNGKVVYRLEIHCEDNDEAWWKTVKVIEQDVNGEPDTFVILDTLRTFRKENYKYCSGRVIRECIEVITTNV